MHHLIVSASRKTPTLPNHEPPQHPKRAAHPDLISLDPESPSAQTTRTPTPPPPPPSPRMAKRGVVGSGGGGGGGEPIPLSRFGALVAQLESVVASARQKPPDALLCFDLLSELSSALDEAPKVTPSPPLPPLAPDLTVWIPPSYSNAYAVSCCRASSLDGSLASCQWCFCAVICLNRLEWFR